MRALLAVPLFLLGLNAVSADAQQCTGLCQQQVSCSAGQTTSISGKVYAPNGTDPLPNVLVFIPNAPVAAMTPGVSCPVPGAAPSGSPLVGASTAADGGFTITNVPVGTNIPLVIQSGRWRRQLVVPSTTACTDTAFSTRMPRNQSEGDIPLIAVATGGADQVECVLRKVGIDDTEFTDPGGSGRIQIYTGAGAAGARIDVNTPSQSTLMTDPGTLNKYDVLMLPCQGTPNGQTSTASLANLLQYANAGGRIYASHYSYTWFYQNGPFAGVAGWLGNSAVLNDGPATVNTSFSGGKTLSDWMQAVGASTTPGQISVTAPKRDISGVNPPTQSWLTLNTPANPVMQFTFNTPVGGANQCGRVLFNEYHVENPTVSPTGKTFPVECPAGAMTNQEKLLEYSLFDLSNDGGQPTLNPTSADFGDGYLGFTSAARTFTWTNNSIFAASVTSATATSDFVVQGNTCSNVQPGASCSITVAYRPTVLGAATGTLTVVSGSNTQTATLTGNGIPALILSTTGVAFGNVDVGATVQQAVTIRNAAPGAVTVPASTGSGDFALTSSCGTLAAGASCAVTVIFKPSATGAQTAKLAVGGATVTATGTGVDFSLALNPSSGTVIAGLGVTSSIGLLPVSGYSASVTITCKTSAPGSTCVPSAVTAVPSQNASLTLKIGTTSRYAIVGYGGLGRGVLALLGAAIAGMLWTVRRRAGARVLTVWMLAALAVGCGALSGCGSKEPAVNSVYTTPGSYTYTVTATDGFLSHTATYSLTVTAK